MNENLSVDIKKTTRKRRAIALFFFLLGLPMLLNCANAPGYEGPTSDHFDGKVFHGRKPLQIKFIDLMKWKFLEPATSWPSEVPVEQQKIPSEWLNSNRNFVTFISHSTIFIRFNGVNILTDPVYSERTSPVSFAGPKRVRKPGIAFKDLPKIDLVLVSHNHYDHLDIETIKKLAKRDNPMVLAGLGNSLLFKQNDIQRCHDLDWNDEFYFNKLKISFVYCQHWSSRGLTDRNNTLWGSFIVENEAGRAIYFAGDTGYSEHFAEQGEKFPNIDLALLPIGAYEPRWFMKYQHMNPADSARAHVDLKARKSMGIHFGTFRLTNEGIDDPALHLGDALRQMNIPEDQFFVPEFGKSYLVESEVQTLATESDSNPQNKREAAMSGDHK